MNNFDSLMKAAEVALKKGNFSIAIKAYGDAVESASNFVQMAQAIRGKGIAFRLHGELYKSECAMFLARSYASQGKTPVLRATIERDLAMSVLDRAVLLNNSELFALATSWLTDSLETLAQLDPTEAAATVGFIGRVLFAQGLKKQAIVKFRSAHQGLRGLNKTYEVDNLVWMAKASAVDCWRYAIRAFWLMARTGSTRRIAEYCVLLVGGNRLYVILRNKARRR